MVPRRLLLTTDVFAGDCICSASGGAGVLVGRDDGMFAYITPHRNRNMLQINDAWCVQTGRRCQIEEIIVVQEANGHSNHSKNIIFDERTS